MLDHSLDADARELGATGVIVMSDEGVLEQHRHTLFVPFFSFYGSPSFIFWNVSKTISF